MEKILVVGQTPPPYGGQAIMIERFLEGHYDDVALFHVRMSFSKQMARMGRFGLAKLGHLLGVVLRIIYFRFRHDIGTLYYPPSGAAFNAILRDMVILILTRWLFKKTIFQFFAGGLSEIYDDLPGWSRPMFRISFCRPDVAIRPSKYSPDDGAFLEARMSYIVNWGTEDHSARFASQDTNSRSSPEILFVGVLKESKGIRILLDACAELANRNFQFGLNIMGEFESPASELELRSFVQNHGLLDRTRFLGVLTGDDYYRHFAKASLFCFPTFFESENVPLVLIDAIQFGLPVVSTSWRGVPSVVQDGVNGFLVPVNDSYAVADRLGTLLNNPTLMTAMGRSARSAYVEHFTLTTFYRRMNAIFKETLLAPHQ